MRVGGASFAECSRPAYHLRLLCFSLLVHLDLLIDKMNEKSSVIKIFKSVPRVLTPDRPKSVHLCAKILL